MIASWCCIPVCAKCAVMKFWGAHRIIVETRWTDTHRPASAVALGETAPQFHQESLLWTCVKRVFTSQASRQDSHFPFSLVSFSHHDCPTRDNYVHTPSMRNYRLTEPTVIAHRFIFSLHTFPVLTLQQTLPTTADHTANMAQTETWDSSSD